ncbi:MAG: NUDIX domain-containing protein [Cyclobacteriaceae bacterium]
MKIYINDIPVLIVSPENIEPKNYDVVIDGELKKVKPKSLIDDVLVKNASKEDIDHLLKLMTDKRFVNLDAVTFSSSNKIETVEYIKEKFKVIKAGGGVVAKDDRILLIFRKKKWDLPKGKLKKKEGKKAGALREVEEECGVKVSIENKICTTWHTYLLNGKYILKKTYWYHMSCLDERHLAPQLEEGIEEVRWMDFDQTKQALYNSYRTIRHVVKRFYALTNTTPA